MKKNKACAAEYVLGRSLPAARDVQAAEIGVGNSISSANGIKVSGAPDGFASFDMLQADLYVVWLDDFCSEWPGEATENGLISKSSKLV